MTDVLKPTPIVAQAVWLKHEKEGKATLRGVADAMTTAGMPVSYGTIKRWKKAGWKMPGKKVRDPTITLAKHLIDAAAPALTGDPTTIGTDIAIAEVPPKPPAHDPMTISLAETENFRRDLESAVDGDLMRASSRELYVTSAVLLRRIVENPTLVEEMPEPIGKLMKALADGIASAHAGMSKVLAFQIEAMKFVPGTVVTGGAPVEDPQAWAFEEFEKARKSHVGADEG